MGRDSIARWVFLVGCISLALVIGAVTVITDQFPGTQIKWAYGKAVSVRNLLLERPKSINVAGDGPVATFHQPGEMAPGLTLIVRIDADLVHKAEVIRPDGSVVHAWQLNIFEIWPEAGELPAHRRPRRLPGGLVHGAVLQPNGDLVFNFAPLSTLRVNACNEIVWKRANLGHHSVHMASDGNIWVGGEVFHPTGTPTGHQNHRSPLREWTAQELSPGGEILAEISMLDLLWRNDLYGLLFATTQEDFLPEGTGDTLHLNDVDVFPEYMMPGIFRPGDIMVSLRNINSVIVFDRETLAIKHRATGMFLRQHDADFTSGNSYTVYDNRNLGASTGPEVPRSRILEVTASPDGGVAAYREIYRGPDASDFFSNTKGRHQALSSGGGLIVVADDGRAIEVDAGGALVWEYRNVVDQGYRGWMTEAERLPAEMDEAFFRNAAAACGG